MFRKRAISKGAGPTTGAEEEETPPSAIPVPRDSLSPSSASSSSTEPRRKTSISKTLSKMGFTRPKGPPSSSSGNHALAPSEEGREQQPEHRRSRTAPPTSIYSSTVPQPPTNQDKDSKVEDVPPVTITINSSITTQAQTGESIQQVERNEISDGTFKLQARLSENDNIIKELQDALHAAQITTKGEVSTLRQANKTLTEEKVALQQKIIVLEQQQRELTPSPPAQLERALTTSKIPSSHPSASLEKITTELQMVRKLHAEQLVEIDIKMATTKAENERIFKNLKRTKEDMEKERDANQEKFFLAEERVKNLLGLQKESPLPLAGTKEDIMLKKQLHHPQKIERAEEFSLSVKSIYESFNKAFISKPQTLLSIRSEEMHFYRISFTVAVLAMFSISLPLTFSLLTGVNLSKNVKIFTQFFACVFALLIIARPKFP